MKRFNPTPLKKRFTRFQPRLVSSRLFPRIGQALNLARKTSHQQQLDLLDAMREFPFHFIAQPNSHQGPGRQHITRSSRRTEQLSIQFNQFTGSCCSLNSRSNHINKKIHSPIYSYVNVFQNCLARNHFRQHLVLEFPSLLQ